LKNGQKSYNLRLSKLKSLKKLNLSVELIKQPVSVNEYGYTLPLISTKRFSVNDSPESVRKVDSADLVKIVKSPQLHKKFIKHNIDRKINTSYTKEEFKSIIAKFGTCSQVGYNPMNPLKMNQDSFVIAECKS
jgi:hypothetical protein